VEAQRLGEKNGHLAARESSVGAVDAGAAACGDSGLGERLDELEEGMFPPALGQRSPLAVPRQQLEEYSVVDWVGKKRVIGTVTIWRSSVP
jgi:hypothetical protein